MLALEADPLETLRTIIAQRLGLAFDDDRYDFLDACVRTRAEQTGVTNRAYCDLISRSDTTTELATLAEMITVGETYFFRNAAQLDACRDRARNDCARVAQGRKLRVLSAACATGEEPYSLAMLFRGDNPCELDVEITAFDINQSALERARRGVYSPWALRETGAAIQTRWFRRDGRTLILDRTIVDDVTLLHGNLNVDDPLIFRPGYYDIVLCRNALMYFTPAAFRNAVARIARSIIPGGFLFLGHAETLRGISHDFHLCHTHETFYYQRKEAGAHDGPGDAPRLATGRAWSQRQGRCDAASRDDASGIGGGGSSHDGAQWVASIQRSAERIQDIAGAPPDTDLVLDPKTDADTLLLQAALLMQEARYSEAEAAARRLLDLDELHAGAQYILAMCCEGRNDHAGATRHSQIAVYLDPTFAMPRFHLGMLQRRAGNRAAARQEFLKAHVLLEREDLARLLMFGGGFGRPALLALCRAELEAGDAA